MLIKIGKNDTYAIVIDRLLNSVQFWNQLAIEQFEILMAHFTCIWSMGQMILTWDQTSYIIYLNDKEHIYSFLLRWILMLVIMVAD